MHCCCTHQVNDHLASSAALAIFSVCYHLQDSSWSRPGRGPMWGRWGPGKAYLPHYVDVSFGRPDWVDVAFSLERLEQVTVAWLPVELAKVQNLC